MMMAMVAMVVMALDGDVDGDGDGDGNCDSGRNTHELKLFSGKLTTLR